MLKQRLMLNLILLTMTTSDKAQTCDWEWKNPIPQSNNLYCSFMISPDTCFMGGADGTFLRTLNGGNDWEYVQVGAPSEHCRATRFLNPDNGMAVLSSGSIKSTTDMGSSWLELARIPDVYLLCAAFPGKDTLFCAGKDGKVLKSIDSGDNWEFLTSGTENDLYGISFVDCSTGWIVGRRGTILKTTDGGQSWNSQESNTSASLRTAYAIDSLQVIVGGRGPVLKTNDSGVSWSENDDFSYLTAISYTNGELFATGTVLPLAKSSNTGNSWEQIYLEELFGLGTITMIEGTGYAAGTNGTLWKTTDDWNTWKQLVRGAYGEARYMALSFPTSSIGFAYIGDDGVLKTTNKGETWHRVCEDLDVSWGDVYFVSADTGFIAGREGIVKTVDGGEEWNMVLSPSDAGEAIYHDIVFWNLLHGIAIGTRGDFPNHRAVVSSTFDGGATWTTKNEGLAPSLEAVDIVNPETGFACGDSGRVLATYDAGSTWSSLETNTIEYLNDIDFINAFRGYAVGNDGLLISTSDGGRTWTQSILSESNLKKVKFVSTAEGFICAYDGAVYHTKDGGATWEKENVPISKEIYDIELLEQTDGTAKVFITSQDYSILASKEPLLTSADNERDIEIPSSYVALSNYPNPFNPSTTIQFNLNNRELIKLQIFDILGRHVQTLIDNEYVKGEHSIQWNGKNEAGIDVAAGIYFVRFQTESNTKSIKLLLIR